MAYLNIEMDLMATVRRLIRELSIGIRAVSSRSRSRCFLRGVPAIGSGSHGCRPLRSESGFGGKNSLMHWSAVMLAGDTLEICDVSRLSLCTLIHAHVAEHQDLGAYFGQASTARPPSPGLA